MNLNRIGALLLLVFLVSIMNPGNVHSQQMRIIDSVIARGQSLVYKLTEYNELIKMKKDSPYDKVSVRVVFGDSLNMITYQVGILAQGNECGFMQMFNAFYSFKEGKIIKVEKL